MADDPNTGPSSGPSADVDLLARLNALRPSSVTLEHSRSNLSIPRIQQAPDSLLSDRLSALRNGGRKSKSSGPDLPRAEQMASAILSDAREQTASAVSKLETPVVDVDDGADRELARDALRFAQGRSHDALTSKPCGPPPEASSGVSAPEEIIKRLRNDAEDGLLKSGKLMKSKSRPKTPNRKKTEGGSGDDESPANQSDIDEVETEDDEDEDRDLDEEAQEAEEILAQLLDEADLEERDEPEGGWQPQTEDKTAKPPAPDPSSDDLLTLPSTPLTLRDPPHPPDPETLAFTNSIEARMAALQRPTVPTTDSLGMPSAPNTRPVSSPSNRGPSKPVPEPTYSCVICYDNATVLCQGCEDNFGDAEEALYCARCWKEGHLGADAGPEERKHEWIKFKRPK